MMRWIAIAVACALLVAGLFWLRHSLIASSDPTLAPQSSTTPSNPVSVGDASLNGVSQKSATETPLSATRSSNSAAPSKRPWETNFLAQLRNTTEGSPIRFKLVSGKVAAGNLTRLERFGSEVTSVSGQLSEPAPGRFFFQKQTLPGVAGSYVGVVEFPSLGLAYRLEPSGPDGSTELVERPLTSVKCVGLPQSRRLTTPAGQIEEIPPLNPDEFPTLPIPDYQQGIIRLESQMGAKPVIYLDFQGGYTWAWGGISYARPNFNNAQIREIWRRVAEDYLPFNINVTTDLRVFQAALANSRQRVIITPTSTADPGSGGAAYVGSFDWTGDTPCWVFEISSPRYCAQACSHEAGHTLGLTHDGQEINGVHYEYYYGHNAGNTNTSWAPIMGVAYYDNVTQWSKGEYIYANNPQDQLAIIASQNNVQYRPDDTGDTLATSRYLEAYDDFTVSAEGEIERTDDTDAFQFTTGGGLVSLRADPANLGPDLAIQAALYNAAGTLLASNHPQDTLWASISTNLPAGTYLLTVTGAGRKDPLTNGFSAYGSLGFYSVTGSVANIRLPTRFVIGENSIDGTEVGIVPPIAPISDAFTYVINSGNSNDTFAIDNFGNLTVADNTALDYEALAQATSFTPQFELFVDIIDTTSPSLSEFNRRVLVVVTNINEPPFITGFWATNTSGFLSGPGGVGLFGSPGLINQGPAIFEGALGPPGSIPTFWASEQEHAPAGTSVGRLQASDPDFYTLLSYSIVAGNSNSAFSIDPDSGTISVAADLVAAVQHLYELTVVVSDQTPPVPLTATSTVTISVELPYQRGGVLFAGYTNIPGTAVSALTSAPGFPLDPAWEDQLSNLEMTTSEPGAFGGVARGYLLPPATGNYTFWVAGQDNCELWLSSSTNPTAMTRIAYIGGATNSAGQGNWTNYPSQMSAPIPLQVGYAYYLEARLKAATTTNYLGVAWECVSNGIEQQIIPGQFLSPYHLNYLPHAQGFTAYLRRNAIAGARIGTIAVSDLNAGDIETLELVSSDQPGMFSLDPNGVVHLVDQAALQDTTRSNFNLTVRVTDNGVPPLSSSTNIVINVLPATGIAANSIAAEIWTNLPGSAVADLTNFAGFPQRPDLVQSLDSLELTSGGLAVLLGLITFTNGGIFSGGGPLLWGFILGGGGSFGATNQTNPPIFIGSTRTTPQISVSPGNSSGSRIRGYLNPTNTGLYTLFISSADDSVLKFSLSTNPANARVVASVTGASTGYHEWTNYSSQQSMPLWLEAGKQYYLEALAKTGLGGLSSPFFGGLNHGHVEVGWTGPGLPETNVVDASFLSPVDLEFPPTFADRTVIVPITSTNGAIIVTLSANDSAADALAYEIVSGNVSNTFALNPVTGELSVADNSSFASYSVSNFVLRVEVQDSGYGGVYPLQSALASVTLSVVDNSPAFVWTGLGENGNWSTPSNWNGTLPNDRSKITFSGLNHRTSHNDFLAAAGLVTLGTTAFYIDGNPLLLHNGLISKGSNTWAVPLTFDSPQTVQATSGTLHIAGPINNEGNPVTFQVDSALIVDGGISGTGGLVKYGSGTLWLGGENTYSGPTSIKTSTLALTNPDSLAASRTINVALGAVLNLAQCSSPYIVTPGQTLTGNGTVIGPTVVEGQLAPASGYYSAVGIAMVFSNGLTLAGNTALTISRNVNQNQKVRVTGQLELGGTLTINTNGFETYFVGDTFRLFDATNITGAFDKLELPPAYKWDTSQLASNATIRVTGITVIGLIQPVQIVNGSVVIRFQTLLGHQYDVESTVSLQPPVHWSRAATRSGTGGMTSVSAMISTNAPQRYFRVQSR
jgi:autotransporter-associated beta strand protein